MKLHFFIMIPGVSSWLKLKKDGLGREFYLGNHRYFVNQDERQGIRGQSLGL